MRNELTVFENEKFGKLEVLVENGKEYFPATEIAKILGYSNPQKAIRDHCREDGCTIRSVVLRWQKFCRLINRCLFYLSFSSSTALENLLKSSSS